MLSKTSAVFVVKN